MTAVHDQPFIGSPRRPDQPNATLGGWAKFGVTCVGLAAGLFLFGFALFAVTVMRATPAIQARADGIIVLTGGDNRIVEGARLLQAKHAERLLISGVNPKTTREDLLRLSGLEPTMFDCCVELGYTAQDTLGNAEEARTWATGRKLNRLIVVTASYHMPRSLAELAIAMPGTQLIPHAVIPRKFKAEAWWLHATVARILLSEYVKYLPVAARLSTMRYGSPPRPVPTITADKPPKPAQS
jgi:uncharacterized SAM-binding protein YcdF (DUF218 family)